MTKYALAHPVYAPAMRAILSISNAFPAVVVTTLDGTTPAVNGYISGTIVRLDIPPGFGMTQVNQMFGTISVINTTSFSIDIDTTKFDPYVVPMNAQQFGQCVPIGEVNELLTAASAKYFYKKAGMVMKHLLV